MKNTKQLDTLQANELSKQAQKAIHGGEFPKNPIPIRKRKDQMPTGL